MRGLSYPEQQLITGDKGEVVGVAVSGPIHWDPHETSASIYVSVSQDGAPKAHGRSGDDVRKPTAEWVVACPVQRGATLSRGHAVATTTAVVFRREEIEAVTWSSEVELV